MVHSQQLLLSQLAVVSEVLAVLVARALKGRAVLLPAELREARTQMATAVVALHLMARALQTVAVIKLQLAQPERLPVAAELVVGIFSEL
jgi:hypothetical protein